MDVVEVDVDDNVEHVVENTPYITLVHTWRSRGVHHRPHTYDVCLAGRIRTRGQLHYSCHNDSWRGGRDTNDARRHIINNEGAHAADAAVRPSNSIMTGETGGSPGRCEASAGMPSAEDGGAAGG